MVGVKVILNSSLGSLSTRGVRVIPLGSWTRNWISGGGFLTVTMKEISWLTGMRGAEANDDWEEVGVGAVLELATGAAERGGTGPLPSSLWMTLRYVTKDGSSVPTVSTSSSLGMPMRSNSSNARARLRLGSAV